MLPHGVLPTKISFTVFQFIFSQGKQRPVNMAPHAAAPRRHLYVLSKQAKGMFLCQPELRHVSTQLPLHKN